MSGRKRQEWVSASELGNYLYCSRKWWLRRKLGERDDERSSALKEAGKVAHAAHGQQVAWLTRGRTFARYLWLIALAVAALALISFLTR